MDHWMQLSLFTIAGSLKALAGSYLKDFMNIFFFLFQNTVHVWSMVLTVYDVILSVTALDIKGHLQIIGDSCVWRFDSIRHLVFCSYSEPTSNNTTKCYGVKGSSNEALFCHWKQNKTVLNNTVKHSTTITTK